VGNLRSVTLRLSLDGSQEKSKKTWGGVPVLGKSPDVGFSEKPDICQKKTNMGHGICGPPAGLYRGSEARPYGHA